MYNSKVGIFLCCFGLKFISSKNVKFRIKIFACFRYECVSNTKLYLKCFFEFLLKHPLIDIVFNTTSI